MNKTNIKIQDTVDSLSELDVYVGKGYLLVPRCSVDTLSKPHLSVVKDDVFGNDKFLAPEAKYVFEKIKKHMAEKKHTNLYLNSAYRSTAQQAVTRVRCAGGSALKSVRTQINQNQFNLATVKDAVDTRLDGVAEKNMSEHTTGLAMDLVKIINGKIANLSDEDRYHIIQYCIDSIDYFGLILRYPEGKRPITGYPYEGHHFRLLDKALANYINYHSDTLEGYYNKAYPYLSDDDKKLVNIM